MPVNPPPVYKLKSYRVTVVPDDCTAYTEGQHVDVLVPDPAPATMELRPGGLCDGVIVVADSPPPQDG